MRVLRFQYINPLRPTPPSREGPYRVWRGRSSATRRRATQSRKQHGEKSQGGANFYKEQLVAPESVMYSWNVALFLSALRLARYRPSR